MIKRNRYTVKKETGCWEWNGAKTASGYGRLKVNNVAWMAHRYSLFLSQGSLGESTVVMHLCDNPSCINPEHLKEGTQADNMADCKAKGRLGNRGAKAGAHRLEHSIWSRRNARIDKVLELHAKGLNRHQIREVGRFNQSFVKGVLEGSIVKW